jgi:nitroreductase
MESFFKTVEKRHSIRSFTDKTIESIKLKKILETALMGPSAKGLQNYRIYIIEDKKKKENLVRVSHDQEYVNAPLLLVFCTEPKKIKKMMGMRGESLLSVQDASIAASYAQLSATALGLSSVWVGNFDEKLVQKIIRTRLRPVVILPIGYPNERPQRKKLKKINDMVFRV